MNLYRIAIVSLVAFLAAFFFLIIGTPANKDYIMARAEARWAEIGYRVVGYEGHQWSWTVTPWHGGAKVWYQLETIKPNGVRYTGFLKRWGDEPLQVYGPESIDAIKSK